MTTQTVYHFGKYKNRPPSDADTRFLFFSLGFSKGISKSHPELLKAIIDEVESRFASGRVRADLTQRKEVIAWPIISPDNQ